MEAQENSSVSGWRGVDKVAESGPRAAKAGGQRASRIWLFIFTIFAVLIALASWRFALFGVEASMDIVAHHLQGNQVLLFAHIAIAPVVLLLAPIQLFSGLRARSPQVHRWVGRCYVFLILISGIAGVDLAIKTTQGPVTAVGFLLLAIAWLGTTAIGWSHARSGRYVQHRRWMLRSVALTSAAITLRLYLGISLGALDLPFDTVYPAIAWLCWVPNWIGIELYLAREVGNRQQKANI